MRAGGRVGGGERAMARSGDSDEKGEGGNLLLAFIFKIKFGEVQLKQY